MYHGSPARSERVATSWVPADRVLATPSDGFGRGNTLGLNVFLTPLSIPMLKRIVLTGCILLLLAGRALGQDDREVLFEAMHVTNGSWVADVGSGDGDYTLPLATAVGDSGRVFAVDINAERLGELNDRMRGEGLENITTVLSVYDNPMLPLRTFDAVLVRNAYHEFTASESMLGHIAAALRPGGRLVMAEYIDDDIIDENRDTQVQKHKLAMRYAREELRQAGFDIGTEVDTLDYWERSDRPDRRLWMIQAVRPEDKAE